MRNFYEPISVAAREEGTSLRHLTLQNGHGAAAKEAGLLLPSTEAKTDSGSFELGRGSKLHAGQKR
jgi:hypothetical protein